MQAPRTAPYVAADEGITLVEVLVAMSVMAVAMAVFSAGIVQMYAAVNRTDASAAAQEQLHVGMQRVEREIRYAAGISVPVELRQADVARMPPGQGLRPGDWYVEYLTTLYSGARRCVQLRLLTGRNQLQARTWLSGQRPSGGWGVLVNSVSSFQPFLRLEAGSNGSDFQRLGIQLTTTGGTGQQVVRRESGVMFDALNTSVETRSETVCSEGRYAP